MTFTFERDEHKYFALTPTKCHDCGKYFFLETGSTFWSTDLVSHKSYAYPGVINYHCKKCTKKRKESNRYKFEHERIV